MLRAIVVAVMALAISSAAVPSAASAAGYCPSQPGGKCPNPKKAAGKRASDFTPEQRKKLMDEALRLCKKTFGAEARVYKIDYQHWRPVCTLNTR